MRANSPVDSGFNILNPVEDTVIDKEPTEEMRKLAKAAKSVDGKIILEHLQAKIDEYKGILENTDFSGYGDNIVALATVMSTQKMIKEFEAVLNDVKISTQAVIDATKEKVRQS